MILNWTGRLLAWAFLTSFQVLVLNHLVLGKYVHPYVFPMIIMMLPFSTPRWLVLIFAFASGLIVDMFNNTPGMQAAAMVVMAFARPFAFKLLTPINGYEGISAPTPGKLGFVWFLLYTLLLTAIHHFVYFNLEVLTWKHIGYTLLTVVLSALFSVFLMTNFAFIFAGSRQAGRT